MKKKTLIISIMCVALLLFSVEVFATKDGPLPRKEYGDTIPADFPDELFNKWFSLPCWVNQHDFDKDGFAEQGLFSWFDENRKIIAVAHVDTRLDGSWWLWGFVEFIGGKACIVWIAVQATDYHKDLIRNAVNGYNEKHRL
jgi:hypothetical protein